MTKTQYKTAGFFLRFITTICDFLIVALIIIGLLFAFITKNKIWDFREPYMFYIWVIMAMLIVATHFLLIPYFTNGRTIGMYITFTRIEFTNNKVRSLLTREAFFSISWCLLFFLSMVVINHTLIGKFALSNQNSIEYSTLDRFRISIVSAVSAVVIIFQLYCASGVIARNDKLGFHDRISQTRTVNLRKTQMRPATNLWLLPPKMVHNELVEWIDGKK